MDLEKLIDIIATEGLGYAVWDYVTPNVVNNSTHLPASLRKAWADAVEALEILDQELEEAVEAQLNEPVDEHTTSLDLTMRSRRDG